MTQSCGTELEPLSVLLITKHWLVSIKKEAPNWGGVHVMFAVFPELNGPWNNNEICKLYKCEAGLALHMFCC